MVSETEYEAGTQVRIVIEGTVRDSISPDADVLTVDTGEGGYVHLEIGKPGVTIERLAPDGWPGEPGSVWTLRTGEAVLRVNGEGAPFFVTNMGGWHKPEYILTVDPNPVLIYTPPGGAS